MKHHEIRPAVEVVGELTLVGEVGIGLVNDYQTIEVLDDMDDIVTVEIIARGIVGRAEPYHLGVLVATSKHLLWRKPETVVERHRAIFDVVDVGIHLVPATGGRDGHHIVSARFGKAAVEHINGLVGAVAHEYLSAVEPLGMGDALLQEGLARVRVSVEWVVVRIFVGIEPHRFSHIVVLVSLAAVTIKKPDVFTCKFN